MPQLAEGTIPDIAFYELVWQGKAAFHIPIALDAQHVLTRTAAGPIAAWRKQIPEPSRVVAQIVGTSHRQQSPVILAADEAQPAGSPIELEWSQLVASHHSRPVAGSYLHLPLNPLPQQALSQCRKFVQIVSCKGGDDGGG